MREIVSAHKTEVLFILTAISISLIQYYLVKRRKSRYELVAKVSKLIIYPVKSLPGVEVESLTMSTVTSYGKYRDRQFMLLDSENVFITMRSEPRLALIKLSLHNQNQIWFDAENFPTLKVEINDQIDRNHVIDLEYRNYPMQGSDCGHEANQWFSNYLSKTNVRLVQNVDTRPARSYGAHSDKFEKKFPILYQDAAPLLIVTENSLTDLNSRIKDENEKISYENFRPNVVISDCEAYEEDNWQSMAISDVKFNFLNPCARCLLTTVNMKTAVKGKEPLVALRTYRMGAGKYQSMYAQSPLFGTYFVPENEGIMRVNDSVMACRKNMVQCAKAASFDKE